NLRFFAAPQRLTRRACRRHLRPPRPRMTMPKKHAKPARRSVHPARTRSGARKAAKPAARKPARKAPAVRSPAGKGAAARRSGATGRTGPAGSAAASRRGSQRVAGGGRAKSGKAPTSPKAASAKSPAIRLGASKLAGNGRAGLRTAARPAAGSRGSAAAKQRVVKPAMPKSGSARGAAHAVATPKSAQGSKAATVALAAAKGATGKAGAVLKAPPAAKAPTAGKAPAGKLAQAVSTAQAAGAAKAAPNHKPSAGEIAARIAGKRAEEAAHKKGKNGKHAESAPRELTPADVEARKRRLKTLIVLGKERGYLTYAEINDHLPDDILDAEQIEGVISMIGDMGIQVYDEAPDADTLLMAETPATVPAADVEEEAEAAASTLDSEFGRT